MASVRSIRLFSFISYNQTICIGLFRLELICRWPRLTYINSYFFANSSCERISGFLDVSECSRLCVATEMEVCISQNPVASRTY